MPIPEVTLPSGICFLNNPHEQEPIDAYADIPTSTGHWRKRRVFVSTPRVVSVQMVLTAAQTAAFDTWFEDVLQAGELPFAAQVKKLGSGMEYWTAYFYTASADEPPYFAEPLHNGLWRISALLRLVGTPADTLPNPTTMSADIVVALTGSATATTTIQLSADITAPLLGFVVQTMSADILVPLDGTVTTSEGNFLLLESGDYLLQESGDRFLLE